MRTLPDVAFAKQLWAALKNYRLVGPDRINVQPFEGNEPHGAIQQVLSRPLKVGDRTAKVIVKVNHGGEDVDVDEVYENQKGMLFAGRVAKGMKKGCIACHTKTGGADLEVLTRTS